MGQNIPLRAQRHCVGSRAGTSATLSTSTLDEHIAQYSCPFSLSANKYVIHAMPTLDCMQFFIFFGENIRRSVGLKLHATCLELTLENRNIPDDTNTAIKCVRLCCCGHNNRFEQECEDVGFKTARA